MLGLIVLAQALMIAVAGPPTSPEYLPIRVADAHGLFAREGLQVTLRSTRAEPGAAEALAQGQADLAATSFEAMLRFGHRAGVTPARIVYGLTAAPPVAVVVATVHADSVAAVMDLRGRKIGFTAPGSPEHTWLQALLGRARLSPVDVELVALGSRGLAAGIDSGDVHAAVLAAPEASEVVKAGRGRLLVDLTSPRSVTDALGAPSLNAAVFARTERRPGDRELTAFARAVTAATRLLRTEPASVISAKLPPVAVGTGDDFERRLETTRGVWLADGLVTADAVAHTVEIARAHLPLPRTLRLPRAEQLLHLDPARRAVSARRAR
jgi:NitT/TauT family transport system substrate-binding protein